MPRIYPRLATGGAAAPMHVPGDHQRGPRAGDMTRFSSPPTMRWLAAMSARPPTRKGQDCNEDHDEVAPRGAPPKPKKISYTKFLTEPIWEHRLGLVPLGTPACRSFTGKEPGLTR
jgi:hypothetical protein